MGTGDNDLVARVKTKLNPSKIMIAGIHAHFLMQDEYLTRHNMTTLAPEQVKSGADEVLEWIAKERLRIWRSISIWTYSTHLCSAPFFLQNRGAENTILATLLKAN